jgi:isopentenyl diphosphate isomerase/L-lactate dehydrogenase-like FMN-dependent dehydrogenase
VSNSSLQVKSRLIIKGIVTREDAALALAHGANGVVISNHGGRDEATLRASIDCVAEVVAAVKGRIPVRAASRRCSTSSTASSR